MSTNNTHFYGYLSGMLTAATLQPLDNIKMTLIVPPQKLQLGSNFMANVCEAVRYMSGVEGLGAFYRGLVVNVWKTGLGSALYFYALRVMESVMEEKTLISTFVTSAAARVVSAVITNPLAVAQTRYQMGDGRWQGSILANLYEMDKKEGMGSFFKGCRASCVKEAGFAGLYYSLYQKGKQLGLSSILSGMSAGMLATLSTHPFEIIRTNNQLTGSKNKSIGSQLIKLTKQGNLFDGVAPRLIKKPAANTIGFLLFQHFERMHLERTI